MSLNSEFESFEKSPHRTMWKWALSICVMVALCAVFFGVLRPAFLFGERIAVESSRQFQASKTQEIQLLESELETARYMAEQSPEDAALQAQYNMVRNQLEAARGY